MLYIIGLGLNERGISKQGLELLKRCKKVYLESYTVEFPYDLRELKLGVQIFSLGREDVESMKLIKEAKGKDIALLVYGSPLFATTHMTLVRDAREEGIEVHVIYAASVFDAIAETGLQLYKFGKTTSMPKWNHKRNFAPDSFMEIVKANQSIDAHTLILIDIDLEFKDALSELETAAKKHKFKLDKIVVCSELGTEHRRIYYEDVKGLEGKEIDAPFCFIIPSKMHFQENEMLQMQKF
jgi:diphthine synthase